MTEGAEYEALKADIKAHGVRLPVWTWQGKVIDGRNRYRVCRELGIDPPVQEWDGNGSLVAFIWSLNGPRRHLTASQRAAIAAELEPMLAREASERRAAGLRRGKPVSQLVDLPGKSPVVAGLPERGKLPTSKPPVTVTPVSNPADVSILDDASDSADAGRARNQAAKLTGSSPRYVSDAKRLKQTDPDAFQKVKDGTLTVSQAVKALTGDEKPLDERWAVFDGMDHVRKAAKHAISKIPSGTVPILGKFIVTMGNEIATTGGMKDDTE